MSNQKYLVIETTIFVDPHGSPDSGGESKFVWEKPEVINEEEGDIDYCKLHNKYTRSYDFEPIDEEDLQGSEDGYNSEYLYFEIKKITNEQYELYKKIIEDYNSIR